DLHALGALDEADRHLLGFISVEFRRLAQNAQHSDAVAADLGVEVGEPVDRFFVDAAVVMERRRRNRKGAGGLGGELCHLCLYPLLSFRGTRSVNPESRDSGFASRPGMTVNLEPPRAHLDLL